MVELGSIQVHPHHSPKMKVTSRKRKQNREVQRQTGWACAGGQSSYTLLLPPEEDRSAAQQRPTSSSSRTAQP